MKRLSVFIPINWDHSSIIAVFKETVSLYNPYNKPLVLTAISATKFQGDSGKPGFSLVPNPGKMHYKADFTFERTTDSTRLHIDYDEGSIMNKGALGKSYVRIYFEKLHQALTQIFEQPPSSSKSKPTIEPIKSQPHIAQPEQPIQSKEKIYCRKCGAQNTTDNSFCGKCGSKLD